MLSFVSRQLQSLENSVGSAVKLILSLVQHQEGLRGQQMIRPEFQGDLGPISSNVEVSDGLDHRNPPLIQRSYSIPHSSTVAQ